MMAFAQAPENSTLTPTSGTEMQAFRYWGTGVTVGPGQGS